MENQIKSITKSIQEMTNPQQVDEREIDSNAQGYPKIDQLISWMESNKLLPKNGREDYVDLNNGTVTVTVLWAELDKTDMKKLISHKAFTSVNTEIVNYDSSALTFNFKYSAL
jgi:hypothetical protein